MVNMTFNQYQKTLHLSYHTCMYLKVDISIVGLGSVRLMSLLKCPSPSYLASNVVYKYTCRCDTDAVYIGETKIHIGTRAEAHMDIQAEKPTAVGKHIKECEDCFVAYEQGHLSFADFPIVKQCKSKFDAEIHEALMIQKENPIINKQLFKSGSSFTLKIFG